MTSALRQARRGPPAAKGPVPGRFAVARAQLVLFWEQLWPVLVACSAPVLLLAIAGLFGVFQTTPAALHWAMLALATACIPAAIWRARKDLRWPRRSEALQRLEADGAVRHAALRALDDRPFAAPANDPLWRRHIDEMRARAAAARLRGPYASADRIDPFALRFAALALLVVALVAAGPERGARLASVLSPGAAAVDRTGGRADLWIEPPAYTGRAPVHLLRAADAISGTRDQIDIPQGSLIVLQSSALNRFSLSLQTPAAQIDADPDAGNASRIVLRATESGVLKLRRSGAEGRWPLGVIVDRPPAVEFLSDPKASDDSRLALALRIDDDYGVTGASLHLRLDPDQERAPDAPAFDETSVRERRVIALDGLAGRSGERRFALDLQADPWAGLYVFVRVSARDGANQTAETSEARVRLPSRPFFNPLARAVIEQRQTLAIAAPSWPRVGRSLDALTLAPDRFYDRATDYLLMRTAFWRVMRLQGENLDSAVEEFWPLALQLEDEALELARRRLEAAQEALREALERGASDEALTRLIEELRAAMQTYLQALAQSGQRLAAGEDPASGELLDPQDLEAMLDAIRNLAQSGAQGAARQALNELANILQNLRLSGGAGQSGQGQPGERQTGAAGEAGDLIGRQRDLSNRAYERARAPGARGEGLAGEEGALAGDLETLLERLRSGGAGGDPDGRGARALGEALGEMRRAEDALSADDFGVAGTAMERAIENLREGAQALAEAEADRQGGQGSAGRASGETTDPLGRPAGAAPGRGVNVPEASDAQRARDILQELRRRLSDGRRDEAEIEYLERLLERF